MSAPVDPAPLIGIPPGWSTLDEAPPPTGFVALEDEPGPLFQANLVVTTELVEVDLAGWQEHVDDMLADILNDYVLIDLEYVDIGGRSGGRRLAAYERDGVSLTLEQWFVVCDGIGHTLSFTVDTWRYDEMADEFEATAMTWEPVPLVQHED